MNINGIAYRPVRTDNTPQGAAIFYSSEYSEYVVISDDNRGGNWIDNAYFTHDKQDALVTAHTMLRETK